MHGQNRRSPCLAVDHIDLQNYFNIPIGKIAPHLVSEQLHIMRTCNKLGSCLGPIPAHSRQRDNPAIGCRITEPSYQRIIIRTRVGQ